MADEPRYTLAEAKLELHREECRRLGHDYQIVLATHLDGPSFVACLRCGRSWGIVLEDAGS